MSGTPTKRNVLSFGLGASHLWLVGFRVLMAGSIFDLVGPEDLYVITDRWRNNISYLKTFDM